MCKKKLNILCFLSLILAINCLSVLGATAATTTVLKKEGKTIKSLIPAGWKLISQASGDLNQDGLSDLAGVIELPDPDSSIFYPIRILFIALQAKDKLYHLSIETEKAFLDPVSGGGIYGDPFSGIEINRGSLLIQFDGGSPDLRWSQKYRFRYQDHGWFMIGVTYTAYYSPHLSDKKTIRDHNLLTGKSILTETDENGKTTITPYNSGQKPLINLKDFILTETSSADYHFDTY